MALQLNNIATNVYSSANILMPVNLALWGANIQNSIMFKALIERLEDTSIQPHSEVDKFCTSSLTTHQVFF